MTAIGETLRRERLRRSLDLEQVSRELKISRRFLEAIEDEKFDRLPGAIFARNFVRQYARLLGLDEDELAGEVQTLLEPQALDTPPQFVPRPFADIPLPRVDQWQAVGDAPRFRRTGSLPALALVVVVMLGCSLVYAFWQRRSHPGVTAGKTPVPVATVHVRPPEPAQQPGQAPPQAQPQTQPHVQLQPQAQPVAPPGSPQPPPPAVAPVIAAQAGPASPPATGEDERAAVPPVAPPDPNAPVRVQVTALEPVWVLARSDGKYLFSGTMEANQTRTIEAGKDVLLRVGNAGGLAVALNGKPLPALGPKGQVRTVQLTSGGFQISVPPKPAPPSDPL